MSSPLRFTPPPPSRNAQASTRLVVVSGLSGSGKTVALRTLEDLEYYCVDNLPVELMPAFVEAVTEGQHGRYPRLAVGVDVRNRPEDLSRLPEILSRLANNGIAYELYEAIGRYLHHDPDEGWAPYRPDLIAQWADELSNVASDIAFLRSLADDEREARP